MFGEITNPKLMTIADISAKGGVVPDLILYNSDDSATGTTDGTVGESTGVGASSNDEQLMQALKLLS